ncbi:alpha-mannosyltransferase [Sporothrix brasiliensis 5110]|uniref:Alpha-mannosyltransferase n=1 Tax=Sporothrix brasiliensis 5110 TaxID=1398154 RepID=A0A0C2J840_9PEZI|nr:alpha-mannosyltransferase [Sporothrix brasiliensis 5110]KIH95150.1 alpha-mannosyltransferase [Sporothrix brasiliensis 5110]
MAGDVVILLSDDSNSDGAFVTPHPPTASPANNRTSAVASSQEATLPPPRLNLPKLAPTTAGRNVGVHADVIEIFDTPAPSKPSHHSPAARLSARPGVSSFPVDDFLTSPFPGAFPTPRLPALSRTPSQPPLSAHRSPPQESMREKAAGAALERLRANAADSDDSTEAAQGRPAKRIRLSPCLGSPSVAPRRAMPTSPLAGTTDSPPRHNLPVQFYSPAADPNDRFVHLVDDLDDCDVFDDALPPTVRPTQIPLPSAPKDHAACIDLLSSSDSERERSRSTTRPSTIDSDFVDIDDLLANPSPRSRQQSPKRQEPQQPGADLWQTNQLGEKQAGHQREPCDEIIVSSSPSVVSPVARSRKDHLGVRPPTHAQPHRERQLRRSLSEGPPLVFSDEEDDVYDKATADALLAEWRESRKLIESKLPVKSPLQPSARRTARAVKRRPSFDETVATDRQKKKQLDASLRRRAKEAERERRQKEKEVERERRKIAADLAKEKKAKEKAEAAAFHDANKSRLTKAAAAPEMVVRLPSTLSQATKETTQEKLAAVKAAHEEWTSRPVDNIVTWRRKVSNDYKPDLGHWVPVPTRLEDEKHALVVLRGDEFVRLVLARDGDPDTLHQTGGHDLDSHVAAVKTAFAGYTIVYLIEGLKDWRSRNKTIRNRQFVAAVRGEAGSGSGSGAQAATAQQAARPSQRLGRRGQKQAPQHLDEALVDEALLDLQMEHSGGADGDGSEGQGHVLVHETSGGLDTAHWIKVFTEQIALSRYRQQRDDLYAAAAASFCMDSGQIATGEDAAESYVLMLQQVARVTEPIAMGVAARYDTVPELLRGFADEGPLALEACLRSRNRNGAPSDRTVGPALSRRLYKVFTGRDPESTDV